MSSIAEIVNPEGALFADRYRVEGLLGQGGMGVVYAAFDPVMKRRVALKRLSAEPTPNVMALFEREYQTLASLKHPRIVEVFEFGRASEGAYYTMELLSGADLSEVAPMPWREVCACLRDAASILGVLHVRKLVHRDLSPRNLWRTPDGRLKLLDFGALAPFGVAKEAMGTPPFIPPEALRGLPLDQRSDLFSLGALGYWLLTSVHAYPAKSMGELHTLWTREPASPSKLVALLENAGEPPPKALEELLYALLRLDPTQRLGSTAELIDRVCALAELPPEGNEVAAQGYLASKVFVGRARERERLLQHITQAEHGQVQALMIEGAPGIGRTRLLEEMAIIARVAGALTIKLDAQLGTTPYGLAATVVEQLIAVSPEARACAMERATTLGTLSAALQVALGRRPGPSVAQRPGELRHRLQIALREVVLSVTRDRLLVLLVDDLHQVDEESQALLSALARDSGGNKLLLVTTVRRDGTAELRPLAQSLRDASVRFRLLALTRAETEELLRSVFGNAPYLGRLAERFHRLSEGNPSHCLELSQHLVRVGAARYAEGMWVLPTDLSGTNLPTSRSEGILGRLSALSENARKLAAQLSVPHAGPFPAQVALEVLSQTADNAGELLGELTGAGVLSASPAGYIFTHEVLRETLLGELTSNEREATHRRLGEALLREAPDSKSVAIAAGLHFMRGGDMARGERLQVSMVRQVMDSPDFEALRNDAPLLEQGLALLKAEGRGDYTLAGHLALLSCCGYFVEREYGERHGDEALATLGRVLKLPLAITLQRFLGGRLALGVALACVAVGIALRRSRPASLQTTIRWLFTAVVTLGAASTVCIDSKRTARYAAALSPFAVLGEQHPASFVYRYARYLSERGKDHLARTAAEARALIAQLRDGEVRGLPKDIAENFLSGAVFALGVTESWRDGPEGLRTADQLEGFSPFYRMAADHLRATWHNGQGNLKEAARYRQLVEVHAIQLGTAWQVETWAPVDMFKTALLTHDALTMKRAAQELSRLAEGIPSLAVHARRARAAYLLLRDKPAEALLLLHREEEPKGMIGWTRSRGLLARAYNALGDHERARAVCLHALSLLDPADLDYPCMNLNAHMELSLAEAGLGNFADARAQLEALLARHEPNKAPLTLGSLHDAYVRVALKEGDLAACAAHLAALDAWYRPTGHPCLLERVDLLRRQVALAERAGDTEAADVQLFNDDVHLITRVQLILTQTGAQLTERAAKGLQIAVELSGADDGFIVLQGSHQQAAVACLDEAPSAELLTWAHRRLMAAYASDETAAVEHVESLIDLNLNIVEGVGYCVAPLWARRDNQDVVVAALALGFRNAAPKLPSADVLRVIADHLVASAKPTTA